MKRIKRIINRFIYSYRAGIILFVIGSIIIAIGIMRGIIR